MSMREWLLLSSWGLKLDFNLYVPTDRVNNDWALANLAKPSELIFKIFISDSLAQISDVDWSAIILNVRVLLLSLSWTTASSKLTSGLAVALGSLPFSVQPKMRLVWKEAYLGLLGWSLLERSRSWGAWPGLSMAERVSKFSLTAFVGTIIGHLIITKCLTSMP